MKYLYGKDIAIEEQTAVSIGNFDGLHLGHKKLISRCKQISRENNLKSVVLSFYPHTNKFFNTDHKMLYSYEEKKNLLETELNPDYLVAMSFNKQLSNLSPEQFFYTVLIKILKAKVICVGFNFFFGKENQGNIDILKSLASKEDIQIVIINEVLYGESRVSSSRIKQLISHGDIRLANTLLTRNYLYKGTVIKGNGLGRKLLVPTANLDIVNEIKPSFGVYASYIHLKGKKYKGITNVGIRPTVKDSSNFSFETYIFDFDEDIYYQYLEIELVQKIREELDLGSLSDLKEQIKKDIIEVEKIFYK